MREYPTATIQLKPKATKSIERRHPWFFSGAIAQVLQGKPQAGDIVTIQTSDGTPVGLGYWNGESNIRLRILTWDVETPIDDDFWRGRIEMALAGREPRPNAARLINAENDFLPGLVVDQYDEWLIMQILSLGIDRRKHQIARILSELLEPRGIFERSDIDIRNLEGLDRFVGVLDGEEPPATITIEENGHSLLVDVYNGHKTGFYLDQRENRLRLEEFIAQQPDPANMRVLNTFCFSGAMTVAALAGGAGQVISVDSSGVALDLAKENVALNGFEVNEEDFIEANVFDLLREYRETGEQFDLIILDPPKFARHAKQVQRASRGYKDINWLAFRLLKPGGTLWTFSCSNAINADLFQKIVFGAMSDANCEAQIIGTMGASSDHPVALSFPEGAYLKGLICRVI